MMSLHFTDTPVVDFETAAKGNNDYFKKYFHGMLKFGVYLPPSAFESYFLNDAISQKDIEHTLEAFSETIKALEINLGQVWHQDAPQRLARASVYFDLW